MSNIAQNLNANGVVVVEPVCLRPEHTFDSLREAVSLFSQTLKKHSIASGFLGVFVVLDNVDTASDEEEENQNVLLTFFWSSQNAIDRALDNPLYQVLLDDVLSHCLSPEGHRLRAPGLVTEHFAPEQISGLKKSEKQQTAVVTPLRSHAIH